MQQRLPIPAPPERLSRPDERELALVEPGGDTSGPQPGHHAEADRPAGSAAIADHALAAVAVNAAPEPRSGGRSQLGGRRSCRVARYQHAGPPLAAALAGMIVVAAAVSDDTRLAAALQTFLILACAGLAVPDRARWSRLLTSMGALSLCARGLLGFGLLVAARAATGTPDVATDVLLMALAVQVPVSMLCRTIIGRRLRRTRPVRLALIGGVTPADMLHRELRLAGVTQYLLVGRIAGADTAADRADGNVPCLGRLTDVARLVGEHDIDMLLMTGECGRMRVFDAVGTCLHLPVSLVELSNFYEDTFGHVPAAEINAAWFQYIVHPSFSAPSVVAKRALDIVGAILIGIPFLIVLAVVAPLIRRDGGPVFFWQTRVGEGGRPLRLCKLRTMRVGSAGTWASADDPRVTRIGHLLRRTHIDELPQLLQILRGEMSLVGPRPEQPHLVEQLERDVAFYSNRHLIKPGIAGWAQLRCGYAGSDVGSAWKLCHDLYYLKHRSFAFDLAILAETVRTLFVDSQHVPNPTATWFIVARDRSAYKMKPLAEAQQMASAG